MTKLLAAFPVILLAACAPEPPAANEQVDLRNLIETPEAGPPPRNLRIEGDLIPTPSDAQSRFYLVRSRQPIDGTTISIIRQERGDRVVYSRTQTDCGNGLFHVLGTGSSRGEVEADVAYDGPLRSTAGLPLRQELATFVCEQSGQRFSAAAS